jgi:hypothetical protein
VQGGVATQSQLTQSNAATGALAANRPQMHVDANSQGAQDIMRTQWLEVFQQRIQQKGAGVVPASGAFPAMSQAGAVQQGSANGAWATAPQALPMRRAPGAPQGQQPPHQTSMQDSTGHLS